MTRRLFPILVLCVVAAACGPQMADPNPGTRTVPLTLYSGHETGPSPVGAIPDVTLRDNARNKDVIVTIEYPMRGEAHPLILFSPAFGGTNDGYVGLSSYWASNGYVVIRVGHNDRGTPGDQAEADWRNRTRDLSFVLDSLGALQDRYPELKGKIDAAKVGVAGHAYGAHTAMLIGGARTFPGSASYADARVRAIVAMSPQGPADAIGLTRESWATLRLPALFLTGSEDRGAGETQTPEWKREAFQLSPDGDKWLVVIEGAQSASFTGRMDQFTEARAREQANIDPFNPNNTTMQDPRRMPRSSRAEAAAIRQQDIFANARGIALAFFDAYLKGEAKGRETLEKAGSRRGVTLEKK